MTEFRSFADEYGGLMWTAEDAAAIIGEGGLLPTPGITYARGGTGTNRGYRDPAFRRAVRQALSGQLAADVEAEFLGDQWNVKRKAVWNDNHRGISGDPHDCQAIAGKA